jgi:hypothetical protein
MYCPQTMRRSLLGIWYRCMCKILQWVTSCYEPSWKHLFHKWTDNKLSYVYIHLIPLNRLWFNVQYYQNTCSTHSHCIAPILCRDFFMAGGLCLLTSLRYEVSSKLHGEVAGRRGSGWTGSNVGQTTGWGGRMRWEQRLGCGPATLLLTVLICPYLILPSHTLVWPAFVIPTAFFHVVYVLPWWLRQ